MANLYPGYGIAIPYPSQSAHHRDPAWRPSRAVPCAHVPFSLRFFFLIDSACPVSVIFNRWFTGFFIGGAGAAG